MQLRVTLLVLIIDNCSGRAGNRCPIDENIKLLLEVPSGRGDYLSGNGIFLRSFDFRPCTRLSIVVIIIIILVVRARCHPSHEEITNI